MQAKSCRIFPVPTSAGRNHPLLPSGTRIAIFVWKRNQRFWRRGCKSREHSTLICLMVNMSHGEPSVSPLFRYSTYVQILSAFLTQSSRLLYFHWSDVMRKSWKRKEISNGRRAHQEVDERCRANERVLIAIPVTNCSRRLTGSRSCTPILYTTA